MLRTDRRGPAGNLSEALEAPRHAVERGRSLLRWKASDGSLRTLTYGEALDGMDRTRGLLAGWGVRAEERVLLATRDDGALAVLVLGCLSHGATAVVCNPDATPREAVEFVAAARPVAAFVDEALKESWPLAAVRRTLGIHAGERAPTRSVLDRLRARATGGRGAARTDGYPGVLASVVPGSPPEGLPDDAEAYVLFTSGSTGRAKGVRISRRSLLHHSRTLGRVFGYDEGSRVLVPLPTYHTDGFLSLVVPWLWGCAALRPVGMSATAAGDLIEAIHVERCTHLVAVPTLLHMLVEAKGPPATAALGPPLRAVLCTAGLLDETLWRRFEETFDRRVSNFYGLTETVTGGLFCGPDDATYRRGTVGRPVDCEVRILGPDDRDAPADAAGELAVRGENVFMGYLEDEAATPIALPDGWFRTGDIATRDADGFVRIVGRAKSTVIFAGHKIQPEEVTRVLEGLPGVREAAAFGVPHETFGEVLVAAVVKEDGDPTGATDLISACRDSLAAYKVPREIDFVESLPRGPSGKVMVAELRERFHGRRVDVASAAPPVRGKSAASNDEVWSGVRETAARAFQVPPERLTPLASPDHTPGWDSFAHLELVLRLEDRFQVKLDAAEVIRIRSLADAQTVVLARLTR